MKMLNRFSPPKLDGLAATFRTAANNLYKMHNMDCRAWNRLGGLDNLYGAMDASKA
jgi:hypothetical protein